MQHHTLNLMLPLIEKEKNKIEKLINDNLR
jgi:hypothetical protein